MAKTTNDIVTYPALNGALTKVKNKLQEQISNAAGGTVYDKKKILLTINTVTNKATVTNSGSSNLTVGEWEDAKKCDAMTFSVQTNSNSTRYDCIGQILTTDNDNIAVLLLPKLAFSSWNKLIIAIIERGGVGIAHVLDAADGINTTIGSTSVKASDGLIELKQGNASLTMQDNAIAANLGSNTSVNAKAGEVTLKQGDAMVQLKSEGILLKQDLSRVQVAGNEIHAVIWEGESAEVYLRIAPDGIWIRSGLVQEGQMRRLRLDKLLSSGFFDW